ncbi:MAG: vWA domain-containing protein [Planctomycetaceae bacterium]
MSRFSMLVLSAVAAVFVAGCGAENGSPHSGAGHRPTETSQSYADVAEVESSAPAATAGAPFDDHAGGGFGRSEAVSSTPAPVAAEKSGRHSMEEEPFVPKSGRQSGLLTAGSFDDVANFDDYLALLRHNRHSASFCQSLIGVQHRQTIINVRDSEGRPIGNARCVVRQAQDSQNETTLLDRHTGSDGRVMLLTDSRFCHPAQQQKLRLQVYVQGQEGAVVDDHRELNGEWNIVVHSQEATLPTALDLALVVDTTGSMGDELEYLKTEIDSIVASVSRMFPDVNQRYSLITYRDTGDDYVCRTFDFTGSLSDFRRRLDAESANGGGDFPEAMDVALASATQLTWRPGNTARVLFLVGDAPPHSQDAGKALAAVEQLGKTGVRIFPVGASGVEKTAEVLMRTASLLTMGQYLFLTDHSGIGNAHATPDVPSFAVERLDRLMLRMIASELAGKRLVAQEVIAIERGERYTCVPSVRPRVVQPVCCPEPVVYCEPVVHHQPARHASLLTVVLTWCGQNGLSMLLAVIAGAVVFDRLTRCSISRR